MRGAPTLRNLKIRIPPTPPHSGAKSKLGVTLEGWVFTSFEFLKSDSPLFRYEKRRCLPWTIFYDTTNEPAAYTCFFGNYIRFYFIFLWRFLVLFKWIPDILLFSRVFLFYEFLATYMTNIVKNTISKYNMPLWGVSKFF